MHSLAFFIKIKFLASVCSDLVDYPAGDPVISIFDHWMFGQMDILGLSLYSTLGLKYDDFGRVLDPERFIPDPATNFLEFRIRIQPILFKHIWK